MTTTLDAPHTTGYGRQHAASRDRRKGRWATRWVFVFLTPWLAGCQVLDPILIDDRVNVWLGLSLVAIGFGGGFGIFLSCRRRLQNWNLEESPTVPDPSRDRNVLIGVAVAAAVLFALYNWFSDIGIPPDQQTANILGWCGGSLVGGVAAYIGGCRLAFSSYDKLAESGTSSDEKPLLEEGS